MYKRIKKWNHRRRMLNFSKKKIKGILENYPNLDKEEREQLVDFFYNNQQYMIPYSWINEYSVSNIDVKFDEDANLYYVFWHGKKMYWKKGVAVEAIKNAVLALAIEQDKRSPHYYNVEALEPNLVVADIGTAEGCYALDVLDKAKHVYVFEGDADWIEPLNKTFEPYKEKVTIINKFVGAYQTDSMTTLDAFFSDKDVDLLKADIEGAEIQMIFGSYNIISSKVKFINICLYHEPSDERNICSLLRALDFDVDVNKGYIYIESHGNYNGGWGCLRRGVAFASRKLKEDR